MLKESTFALAMLKRAIKDIFDHGKNFFLCGILAMRLFLALACQPPDLLDQEEALLNPKDNAKDTPIKSLP